MYNFMIASAFMKNIFLRLYAFFFVFHFISNKKADNIKMMEGAATTATSAAKAVLKQGKSVLLICDLEERFTKPIFESDKIIKNSSKLINALKILNVPMIVSEQAPGISGRTIHDFNILAAKGPFTKTQFSMYTPEIYEELSTICSGKKPNSIILMGFETHVCIEHTAIDLRQNGYEVHTVADCCSSRTEEDKLLALQRMRDLGCHITTSENVIFKLLRNADHKKYREIMALVETPFEPAHPALTPKM